MNKQRTNRSIYEPNVVHLFCFCRVIKSEITKIHLNLAIAVGVAQVLFLAAGSENLVQREVNKIASHRFV